MVSLEINVNTQELVIYKLNKTAVHSAVLARI